MGSTNALSTTGRVRSGRGRPAVLAAVTSGADASATLFDAMAAVAAGADGIDLGLPADMGPVQRLGLVDQLADVSGLDVYVRSPLPMSAGRHRVIRPVDDPRPAHPAVTVFDIGLDRLGRSPADAVAGWQPTGDGRPQLLATVGFGSADGPRVLSDAALMGLATFACVEGLTAVSTDRVRTVRRVVDTLAPVLASSEAPCR